MRKLKGGLVAVVFGLWTQGAWAAPVGFEGAFWDADIAVRTLSIADRIIAAGDPTATFTTQGFHFLDGEDTYNSKRTTLDTFLGPESRIVTGSGATTLTRSVLRFTGTLLGGDGLREFVVRSDSGFRLTVGEQIISSFSKQRAYAATSVFHDTGTGPVGFELIYFENAGRTGLTFDIDGRPVSFFSASDSPTPAVPLPSALPMLGSGLLILACFGRRTVVKRRSPSA